MKEQNIAHPKYCLKSYFDMSNYLKEYFRMLRNSITIYITANSKYDHI